MDRLIKLSLSEEIEDYKIDINIDDRMGTSLRRIVGQRYIKPIVRHSVSIKNKDDYDHFTTCPLP